MPLRRVAVFSLALLAVATLQARISPLAAAQAPPAPQIILITQTINILEPDGTFVAPQDRSWTVWLSWQRQPGFSGVYEVERSLQLPGQSKQPFEIVASQPPQAVESVETYSDKLPFLESETVRCYRIRTNINGERGPYSEEICWQKPVVLDAAGPLPEVGLIYTSVSDGQVLVTVHWKNPVGFTGTYEVQRTTGPSRTALGALETVGSVPARQLHYQERFPAEEVATVIRCYRLQPVPGDGPTRPPSELACFVPPPHSGGTATPLPPDTGSGPRVVRRDNDTSGVLAVASFLLGSLSGAAAFLWDRSRG